MQHYHRSNLRLDGLEFTMNPAVHFWAFSSFQWSKEKKKKERSQNFNGTAESVLCNMPGEAHHTTTIPYLDYWISSPSSSWSPIIIAVGTDAIHVNLKQHYFPSQDVGGTSQLDCLMLLTAAMFPDAGGFITAVIVVRWHWHLTLKETCSRG